eukprot:CAMPEP_0206576836 /NCGR_PEP_ID=MMETSP0325_2-20121206/30982_1 /ASSEMBLY_ACC=CAM_ASM_000347 /TAXON_ID=2866 /ORGANISM="Crypthecodinium cohnii, Strain Seligo" /LENGTH=359 /DNA_ID=CAMNT_0054082115 /DNA_START=14 /DNA_END=1093 /DNA_ORIENTATION=-
MVPGWSGVETIATGHFTSADCNWKLYRMKGGGSGQVEGPVNLFTFLHGLDDYQLPAKDMEAIDRHLGGNTLFLVPRNPRPYWRGKCKMVNEWSMTFKASDDRTSRGHCFGDVNHQFNQEFSELVGWIKESYCVDGKAIIYGYSAGGLGALLLALHDNTLFQAVIAAASYAPGTLEVAKDIPQPQAKWKFTDFLKMAKERLMNTRTYFVHFKGDRVSLFGDVKSIAEGLQQVGAPCELLEVGNQLKKTEGKKASTHSYYYSTLIWDSAESFFWSKFREDLWAEGSAGGWVSRSSSHTSYTSYSNDWQPERQSREWRASSGSRNWGRGWDNSRWQNNWEQDYWQTQARSNSWKRGANRHWW